MLIYGIIKNIKFFYILIPVFTNWWRNIPLTFWFYIYNTNTTIKELEDIIMLKKFALWFICFGLSFLVESWGWAEQGKAFMYIDLGAVGLILAVVILICLFAGDGAVERLGIPLVVAICYVAIVAVILFATWGATELFNVDYYVAYQIMTFGQCLCTSSSSKKD